MQFVLSFAFIYILSTMIGQNMRVFNPAPKAVNIKSKATYSILTFPYNLIGNKKTRQKERSLTLSELIFCAINRSLLVGTVILQILPKMPCEVIEITFGRRHRWLNIILDTYNQKIPIATVIALVGAELLILFGGILIRSIRDAEFRKKLGTGALIATFLLCLLFLVGVISSIFLLF